MACLPVDACNSVPVCFDLWFRPVQFLFDTVSVVAVYIVVWILGIVLSNFCLYQCQKLLVSYHNTDEVSLLPTHNLGLFSLIAIVTSLKIFFTFKWAMRENG